MLPHPPYSPDISQPDFDLFPKLKKPLRGKRFRSIKEVSNEVTRVIRRIKQRRHPDRNTRLAQTLDRCDKAQWRLHWRPVNVFCKINSCLKRKRTVCRTFEMIHVLSPVIKAPPFSVLINADRLLTSSFDKYVTTISKFLRLRKT